MSIAILPMSQEFNWNSATVGLIQSSFFWGYLLTQVRLLYPLPRTHQSNNKLISYIYLLVCIRVSTLVEPGIRFLCYLSILDLQEYFSQFHTNIQSFVQCYFVYWVQILGGIWADKIGGKLVLGFGVVWWSMATVLTPIAARIGLPCLLIMRAFMGIGEVGVLCIYTTSMVS